MSDSKQFEPVGNTDTFRPLSVRRFEPLHVSDNSPSSAPSSPAPASTSLDTTGDAHEMKPYRIDLDATPADAVQINSLLDPTGLERVKTRKRPSEAISDSHFDSLAAPYLASKLVIMPGFGAQHYKKFPDDTASGYKLSCKNTRYLLGVCHELLLPQYRPMLSLDLLVECDMLRALAGVFQARSMGQRTYQLALELKAIMLWVFDQAHSHLSQRQRADVVLSRFPAWGFVEGLVRSTGFDRKQQDKTARMKDERTLIEENRLISREELGKFVSELERWFQQPDPAKVTAPAAYAYQLRLIGLIVSGAISPVTRAHTLVNLRIGVEVTFDEALGIWKAESPMLGKGRTPIKIHFHRSANVVFKKWITLYRPVLVAGLKDTHDFLFVKKDGRPRTEIAHVVDALTMTILGRSVSTHKFRHRQCIDEKEDEASQKVREAMAAGRSHTTQTMESYYARHNADKQAEAARQYIEQKWPLGKRNRGSYERDGTAGLTTSAATDDASHTQKKPRVIELPRTTVDLDSVLESALNEVSEAGPVKPRRRKRITESDEGEFRDETVIDCGSPRTGLDLPD